MDTKFNSDLILKNTYRSIKTKFAFYLSLTIVFILLNFAISYIILELKMPWKPTATPFIYRCALLIVYAKMAIMVHQAIILKIYKLSNIFRWSTIELKFLGLVFGLYFAVIALFFVIFSYIVPVLHNSLVLYFSLAFYVVLSIIFARIAITFASIAVAKPISLLTAWQKTRGKTRTLFALLIIVPFFTSRLLKLLPEDHLKWDLLSLCLTVFVLIFEVTMASHCYEQIIDSPQHSDSTGKDLGQNVDAS